MLANGAFVDTPRAQANRLVYWRFAGTHAAPEEAEVKAAGVDAAAFEALSSLEDLLAKYREAGEAFLSKPRAFFAKAWTDYDQLARRKEWASEGEE
jgi:ATP-dependent helicase/nuclease subunit B